MKISKILLMRALLQLEDRVSLANSRKEEFIKHFFGVMYNSCLGLEQVISYERYISKYVFRGGSLELKQTTNENGEFHFFTIYDEEGYVIWEALEIFTYGNKEKCNDCVSDHESCDYCNNASTLDTIIKQKVDDEDKMFYDNYMFLHRAAANPTIKKFLSSEVDKESLITMVAPKAFILGVISNIKNFDAESITYIDQLEDYSCKAHGFYSLESLLK